MADHDSEPDAVQVSHPAQGITLITLNRSHRRNAVDAPTACKLYAAFLAFEVDSDAKIAILYGAGGTFCAGFDLHTVGDVATSGSLSVSSPSLDPAENSQGPMGPSRLHFSKPLIAAVSGYAVAGGLELSLLADMRVVDSDATFGVFCRRWGVPLIDGGTVRLRAIVGLGRALDMILTGRAVGAKEALDMGLANRVVPPGKALEEAVVLAKELMKFPQECMNVDRESCYFGAYQAGSMKEALKHEYDGGQEALKKEGGVGAARFSKGAGRGGSFAKL